MDLTEAEQALLMLMLASYHRKHWTGNHFIFATGVIRACDHNLQNKTTCQKVLESLAKKCPYVYPSYPNSEHGKGWYYVDRETVIKEWWQMKTAKREPSHDNYVDLLEAAGMA